MIGVVVAKHINFLVRILGLALDFYAVFLSSPLPFADIDDSVSKEIDVTRTTNVYHNKDTINT